MAFSETICYYLSVPRIFEIVKRLLETVEQTRRKLGDWNMVGSEQSVPAVIEGGNLNKLPPRVVEALRRRREEAKGTSRGKWGANGNKWGQSKWGQSAIRR